MPGISYAILATIAAGLMLILTTAMLLAAQNRPLMNAFDGHKLLRSHGHPRQLAVLPKCAQCLGQMLDVCG